MLTLLIDDKTIQAHEGANLLAACLQNDIYIPNLCYIEGMSHPPSSCRLCFIEIEGEDYPIPACTQRVRHDMVVRTDTTRVRQLQKTALQLLLSVHDVDCKNCPANRRCVLQDMAKFLKIGLKSKHLELFIKNTQVDQDHPFLNYFPNRCVLCGRCVYVCDNRHNQTALTFSQRGINTVIGFFGNSGSMGSSCVACLACADVCPVAALLPKT